MGNNPRVQLRRPFAALLLMTVAGMPLFWLGAHALQHHEHAEDAAESGTEWSELAKILVHGHEHAEGVPDHEHDLLPSPTSRPDAPRDLPALDSASLEAPDTVDLQPAGTHPARERIGYPGSSPPRLHLLCTLLI